MNKFNKFKVIAILVCGGVAGSVIAADTSSTSTTSTQTQQVTVQPSDATITKAVKSALSDYAGAVSVTVKGGVVYLSGELPSDTDYDQVITVAKSIKGAADVDVDKLTVKNSNSPMHDTYITAKVKGSLIQSDLMGKDIPSWSVKVETKDGQVYLSGTIATQQQKQNVLNVVNAVKGVTQVIDKIELAPATDSGKPTINNSSDEDSTGD